MKSTRFSATEVRDSMDIQRSFKAKKPTLFLVATPIGNLSDMSERAVETLQSVAAVFAEDTRVSGPLLSHFNVNTSLYSLHAHNESRKRSHVLNYLHNGEDIAYITDAGTPLLSDPGSSIVRAVIDAGYYVVAIPGANAAVTALTVSGLMPHPFMFYGFLPTKAGAREKTLHHLASLTCTLVFYETPNRMKTTLAHMYQIFGERDVSIAREITKQYETVYRFKLSEYNTLESMKGEAVLIVSGADEPPYDTEDALTHVTLLMEDGLSEKEAIKIAAKARNVPKNTIYMMVQNHKNMTKDSSEE